jgi:hypothetical protein
MYYLKWQHSTLLILLQYLHFIYSTMEPLFLSFTLSSKGYCNLPPMLFLEQYYPTTLLIRLQYIRSSTMEPPSLFLSFTLSSKGYCILPPMLFLCYFLRSTIPVMNIINNGITNYLWSNLVRTNNYAVSCAVLSRLWMFSTSHLTNNNYKCQRRSPPQVEVFLWYPK